MFRFVLTRMVGTSRVAIRSAKIITDHRRYCLRNLSYQSKNNNDQSKIQFVKTNEEKAKRMGIRFRFRCKVCDHILQKTFTRKSYEQGVVIRVSNGNLKQNVRVYFV